MIAAARQAILQPLGAAALDEVVVATLPCALCGELNPHDARECDNCGGDPPTRSIECPACDGVGEVYGSVDVFTRYGYRTSPDEGGVETCGGCGGEGRIEAPYLAERSAA